MAWRLARRMHSDPPRSIAFNGRGAEISGGRWNPIGVPAAYASSTRSLAALELLVHIDPIALPSDLVFAQVTFSEADVERADPPAGWAVAGSTVAVTYGERWLREMRTLVLAVPSVVLPSEMNYVMNPRHPDAITRLEVGPTLETFVFDSRLLPEA